MLTIPCAEKLKVICWLRLQPWGFQSSTINSLLDNHPWWLAVTSNEKNLVHMIYSAGLLSPLFHSSSSIQLDYRPCIGSRTWWTGWAAKSKILWTLVHYQQSKLHRCWKIGNFSDYCELLIFIDVFVTVIFKSEILSLLWLHYSVYVFYLMFPFSPLFIISSSSL